MLVVQDLFRQAICQSSLPGGAPGYLWYPYGYAVGFLARRAQFLLQPDVQQLLGVFPTAFAFLLRAGLQATSQKLNA